MILVQRSVGWGLVAMVLMAGLVPAHAQQEGAKAKNVIVLIADGCSSNHFIATDYYEHGERGKQIYEQTFEALAMSTFPDGGSYDPAIIWADFDAPKKGATDSAAAATAMSTGVKTYKHAIGVGPDKTPVPHVVEAAEKAGKATGIVTSVFFTHGTPAGFVAHNTSRSKYDEIGKEMLLDSAVDVIMGSGNPAFDDAGERIEDQEEVRKRCRYVGGEEAWEAVLAGRAGGDADGDGTPDPWTMVQTRAEFQGLAEGETPKRVLGVAQVGSTLQQERESIDGEPDDDAPYQTPLNEALPTLAEMTKAALNVLDEDPDGFFLMVEGGAVDWASHDNQLGRMIEEMIDFNNAIEAAVAWVEANSNWDESLVVITTDHECGYLTGPGSDPEFTDVVNNGKGNLPGAEWHHKSHTNLLVPFYARGAGVDALKACATNTDPKYGAYLDNTDLGKVAIGFMK